MPLIPNNKEGNVKRVCTIYPNRLSCLQYSQLHVNGLSSPIETCRYLISKCSSVFCSPQQYQKRIGILFFPEQGDITALLDEFRELGINLNTKSKRAASLEDVLECLAFTLPVRLSLQWNPIGKWFIHGKQDCFLNIEDQTQLFQAIQFNFQPSDLYGGIDVLVGGGELRLFPITPYDLVLNSEDLTVLMEDPKATINLTPNPNNRFYYLPKVTAGNLISISRCLPESSPFKHYNDLCTYWQQQYGYKLPDDPNGIVYFNVMFANEGTLYTYPSCCVFLKQPEILPISVKTNLSIVRQFWKDFEPIFQSFPGKIVSESWLSNPLVRVPWQQKFAEDIEYDAKMRSSLGTDQDTDKGISKYFLRVHADYCPKNKENAKEDQRKVRKTKQNSAATSQQNVSTNKITKYFTPQRSNVNIRRSSNKVTFKPKPSISHSTSFNK